MAASRYVYLLVRADNSTEFVAAQDIEQIMYYFNDTGNPIESIIRQELFDSTFDNGYVSAVAPWDE